MVYSILLFLCLLLIGFRPLRSHQERLDNPWLGMLGFSLLKNPLKGVVDANRRKYRNSGSADSGTRTGSSTDRDANRGARVRPGRAEGARWRLDRAWVRLLGLEKRILPITGQDLTTSLGFIIDGDSILPERGSSLKGGRIELGPTGMLRLEGVYCEDVDIAVPGATTLGVTLGNPKAAMIVGGSSTLTLTGTNTLSSLSVGTGEDSEPVSELPRRNVADPIVAQKIANLILDGATGRPCFLGTAGYRYTVEQQCVCGDGLDAYETPHDFLDCHCGFYALNEANEFKPIPAASQVKLDVELLGRVLVCTGGYRAEYQRVLKVWIPPVCYDCGNPATAISSSPGGPSYAPFRLVPTCGCSLWLTSPYVDLKRVSLAELANALGTEVGWLPTSNE